MSALFDALLGPSVGDIELLQALLDVEAALAHAGALAELFPTAHATLIASACVADRFDLDALATATRLAGNPLIPLVAALIAAVADEARGSVHVGGTSQDIIDTAVMLIAARRRHVIDTLLTRTGDAAAVLAETHRRTVMAGRTLLQHALPITFGLKAAQWLAGISEARNLLRQHKLTIQFGGAAGTLASVGSTETAATMRAEFARRLGLVTSLVPWHTNRVRTADLGATLAIVCGTLAKVALDVELLMQTDVGEVFEGAANGKGESSTLPHKRNPVSAVSIRAAHHQAVALAGLLLGSMAHEHERAAAAWQAEWEPLLGLLRLAEGSASQAADMVEGLEVDGERMRANLDMTDGRMLGEAVVSALRPTLGRERAEAIVKDAAAKPGPLRTNLARVPQAAALGDAPFDPANYLGSTDSFIDHIVADWSNL